MDVFSCGKSGHAATLCPNLNESFPFMQPGWRAEKTPGGGGGCHYDPTSGVARPTEDGKRRLIRGKGSPPGSVVLFDPMIPGEGQRPLLLPD